MNINKSLQEIESELADAERMHDRIKNDPRRKLAQPCEKLHYWDGKVTGLRLALELIKEG